MIKAFRIHYIDGTEIEGNYYKDWLVSPIEGVTGVEFFYDEWDKNGFPRHEVLVNQDEYAYPGNEDLKIGVKTPRGLATKINKLRKPLSINPTKEGDLHVQPSNAMKGL